MTRQEYLQHAIGARFAASESTVARLDAFAALVAKWNPAINLIARSTLADMWMRHIIDSAQLFRYATPGQRMWVDLGSGGGFPGIVIGLLASEFLPELRLTLVESDKRKAAFLSESARQLSLSLGLHRGRIEDLDAMRADVVSARALAPLEALFSYAAPHLGGDGQCVFLKGENAEAEIAQARRHWQFDLDCSPSVTDSRASVLVFRGVRHV